MQVPASMLLVATLVIAAGAAVISPAQAEPTPQLSNGAYLAAAHCAGLAEGAKRDTKHIDALLAVADGGRFAWMYDRAQDQRLDGLREARRASGAGVQQVNNELSACAVYLGTPQTTSVASTR